VFHSLPDLITALEKYLALHNQAPKPFVWTAQAKDIPAKVTRARKKLHHSNVMLIKLHCTGELAKALGEKARVTA
jgi:hypothetical protein